MKRKTFGTFEVAFDAIYLLSALSIGVCILLGATSTYKLLFGTMALVLVFGDAFHLLPRIASALSDVPQRYAPALGRGKMVTSIGMTLFYGILWQIGVLFVPKAGPWWPVVYGLAAIRIALCMPAQNRWVQDDALPSWNLLRNIPFVLLGAAVCLLFLMSRPLLPSALEWMGVAVLLSFAFYLPVVLFAKKHPAVGMLMIPKTCAYVWILFMGLL